MIKKLLNIGVWAIIIAGVIGSLAFTQKEMKEIKLTDINVLVDHSDNNYFILKKDISTLVKDFGYIKDSLKIDSLRPELIEKRLKNNPSVKSAEVYIALNGALSITITQRSPLLRIFNNKNESFYLDREGGLMPTSKKYTARVPIASGDIKMQYASITDINKEILFEQVYQKQNASVRTYYSAENTTQLNIDTIPELHQLKSLYEMAKYINNNDFWKRQITHIEVLPSGDFVLIPLVGPHQIIFGDAQHLDKKFNKLMVFYKEGLTKTGWNEYSTINLKFNNQVVCTKKYP